MARSSMTLEELRRHLNDAKDMLSADKQDLLRLFPLTGKISREAYGFAYIRAERHGMRVINRKLADIAWLPMQLDARAEVIGDHRNAMKRWLKAEGAESEDAPTAEVFGNDFIHALARGGILHGWDNGVAQKLAARIGNLFRDLSCLIGLVYYCSWLEDHGVERFPLSDGGDLAQMAQEMALLLQSAQISAQLRRRELEAEKPARKSLARPPRKSPELRLIDNPGYVDPFMPEPAGV